MKNNKGFTLIELLVTIVILVGIGLIAIPNIANSLNQKNKNYIEEDRETLLRYLEIYMVEEQAFSTCMKQNNGYVTLESLATKKNIELKSKDFVDNGLYIYQNGEIVVGASDEYNPTEHQNCVASLRQE